MHVVSKFESDLLHILSFILGRLPREQAMPILAERRVPPKCLSRSAVTLIQEALAKGCVHFLARGGWQPEAFCRNGRVHTGRLWQRSSAEGLKLRFSEHSLRFLIWITAGRSSSVDWLVPEASVTVADLLLIYLAFEVLRGSPSALDPKQSALKNHGLCRLAYPADYQGVEEPPNFTPWITESGAYVLESMQLRLARRWVGEEENLAVIHDWEKARRLARARERVLNPYLDSVATAGRRDLARFLLRAAAILLAEDHPAPWGASLQDAGPRAADRLTTFRAVLYFPLLLERLQAWERKARSIGYVDEGYTEAQLWKTDWERWQGEVLHARAQSIIRRLDPLAAS